MEFRLVVHILAVVTLVSGSLVAMADQSSRLVGVHEIPPFVTERVELPADAGSRPAGAGGARAAGPTGERRLT